MSLPAFKVSFDIRCPFAKNIHLHLVEALRQGADFEVTFVPWTLSQGHREDGAPDVWDDPARDAEHLSLCVDIAIRDGQPDRYLDAHEALFRARHERGIRLVSEEEIRSVLEPLGVDVDAALADVATRRPHAVLKSSYEEFAAYEAFGVPTFVVGSDATFVRYMTPPDEATDSTALITNLVQMMVNQPGINEFKHTRLPA
jgi:protein-disulfide isomerase